MNLAVFELFPCLLHAKQNEIKRFKRPVNKVQTQGDRLNNMSSGFSKELNVQNVSYFMEFSSYFRKLVHITIFQIRRNIMPKDGSHLGYSLLPSAVELVTSGAL